MKTQNVLILIAVSALMLVAASSAASAQDACGGVAIYDNQTNAWTFSNPTLYGGLLELNYKPVIIQPLLASAPAYVPPADNSTPDNGDDSNVPGDDEVPSDDDNTPGNDTTVDTPVCYQVSVKLVNQYKLVNTSEISGNNFYGCEGSFLLYNDTTDISSSTSHGEDLTFMYYTLSNGTYYIKTYTQDNGRGVMTAPPQKIEISGETVKYVTINCVATPKYAGQYVVSKDNADGEAKYHLNLTKECPYAANILEGNKWYFDTPEQAATAGYGPCSFCVSHDMPTAPAA